MSTVSDPPSVRPSQSISRRGMLRLTGGALLGAAMLGCGNGSGDKNTLTFVVAEGQGARALKPLIAEFMETHPAIKVVYTRVPWDQTHSKLLTTMIGGNPPDVFALSSPWMAEFRAVGGVENLKPWYQSWAHKDVYPETIRLWSQAAMAFEGEDVYGIPLHASVRAMFYRQEWLDEHDLKPASTLMEWRGLLEKLTDKRKSRYGYAFRGARGGFFSWWAIAGQFAGTNEWFDADHRCIINSPDHVAGLSFWNDLYQDGLAPLDAVNWGYTELVQGFWSGLCGTMEQDPEVIQSCLEHGLDESTLTTTVMPGGPKARVTYADMGFVSMAAGSPRKDTAWEFLSWLMAPAQNIRYCRAINIIPPLKAGLEDPAFGQGLYRPFRDMMTDDTMLPSWSPNYLPEMGEFLEIRTTEEHQNMLLNKQSPEETLDRLADFMTRAEKKYIDRHGPDTPRPPRRP